MKMTMKTIAVGVAWAAIASQTVWLVANLVQQHGSTHGLQYALYSTVGFAAIVATRGRYRWIVTILRMYFGVVFLGAVGDRLGMSGSRSGIANGPEVDGLTISPPLWSATRSRQGKIGRFVCSQQTGLRQPRSLPVDTQRDAA